MDTLPCPGCHTALPPEATGCQICMRARTKQEIMRGYAKLRDDKARKRRLPFQLLAALLVLGGGGKLLMVYRSQLAASASSLSGKVRRWSDDMRDPKNYSAAPAPPAPAPADPTASPAPSLGTAVPPEDALREKLFPTDAAPQRQPAASGSRRGKVRAAPRAAPKNSWRVSGGVYDLATLAPVPGAVITFLRDGTSPETATTDEKGAYEIDLAKGDGWTVDMKVIDRGRGGARDNRYRGMLVDIDPPYRVRDADERRATIEHISDGDMVPSPLDWKKASSRVKLDLIAVPSRWTEVP